jgi:hypothetical protein
MDNPGKCLIVQKSPGRASTQILSPKIVVHSVIIRGMMLSWYVGPVVRKPVPEVQRYDIWELSIEREMSKVVLAFCGCDE